MNTTLRGTSCRTLRLSIGSGALATLAQYAANLVLARIVFQIAGVEIFGAWATISSILAVGGLADAGITMEISRRVADASANGDRTALRRTVHEGTTMLAWIAAVVVLVGCVSASAIGSFAFPAGITGVSSSELDMLLRATFVLLGVTLFADGYFAALRGVQRADIEMKARFIGIVTGTAIAALGIASGWGLWALLAGSVASTCTQSAVQAVRIRSVVPEVSLRLVSLRDGSWRTMLGLSSMLLLSQVSDVIDSQWDKLVLSRYLGSAAVANFQVGTALVLQTKALALLPLAPLLVAMAELRYGDPKRRASVFHALSVATTVAGAVALSGVIAFAPAFLRLWLGEDLPEAATAARLFAIAVGLNLLAAPLAFKAIADGKHRLTACASACNIAVNAGVSFFLTLHVGFRGPLWGSIAGNAVGSLVFFGLMRQELKESFSRASWSVPIVCALGCGISLALGVSGINTWPGFLLSGLLFVIPITAISCRFAGIEPVNLLRGSRG